MEKETNCPEHGAAQSNVTVGQSIDPALKFKIIHVLKCRLYKKMAV